MYLFISVYNLLWMDCLLKYLELRNLRIRCYDNGITGRSLQEAFSLIALRSLSISFVGLSSVRK